MSLKNLFYPNDLDLNCGNIAIDRAFVSNISLANTAGNLRLVGAGVLPTTSGAVSRYLNVSVDGVQYKIPLNLV